MSAARRNHEALIAAFDDKGNRCSWPEGDVSARDLHFCGAERAGLGKSYCPAHMAIAYVPLRGVRIKKAPAAPEAAEMKEAA